MARRVRRFWSEEEKRRIVAQTWVPGVSVSQVGRRYDVNANLIFKWRRDPRYRPAGDGEGAPSFLPVEVVPEPSPAPVRRRRRVAESGSEAGAGRRGAEGHPSGIGSRHSG